MHSDFIFFKTCKTSRDAGTEVHLLKSENYVLIASFMLYSPLFHYITKDKINRGNYSNVYIYMIFFERG